MNQIIEGNEKLEDWISLHYVYASPECRSDRQRSSSSTQHHRRPSSESGIGRAPRQSAPVIEANSLQKAHTLRSIPSFPDALVRVHKHHEVIITLWKFKLRVYRSLSGEKRCVSTVWPPQSVYVRCSGSGKSPSYTSMDQGPYFLNEISCASHFKFETCKTSRNGEGIY